jgi:4-azaleucine resistance transporter AzlC
VRAKARRAAALAGVRDALPIVAAYLPVGATFGVVAHAAHWPAWLALASSATLYAGAAQFLLVGLSAAHVPAPAALFVTLAANVRHLLYAAALAPRLRRHGRRARLLVGFGLTDEVFALTAARPAPAAPAPPRQVSLELTAFAAWLAGTAAGAAGAMLLPAGWSDVLAYALPALFVALLAGLARTPSHLAAAAVGGAAAVAADLEGWGAVAVVAGALAGALAGVLALSRHGPRS